MSSALPPSPLKNVTVPFRTRSNRYEQFQALFREGMGLVEEAANYLDGPGRLAAKTLPPYIALAYATESMRLTTRLTQLASWLLARRAVYNGETLPRAGGLNDPLQLPPVTRTKGSKAFDELPVEMRDLIAKSYQFHEKINRFDATEQERVGFQPASSYLSNGVAEQMEQLQSAFMGHS